MDTPTFCERFWARVDRSADCWQWTGARAPKGYGLVSQDGTMHGAHRIAYELEHGPIPPGFHVMHRCDNPPCVRPSHLVVGDHADNMADMVRKRRHIGRGGNPRGNPQHGEANGSAKLTASQVAEIRATYRRGQAPEFASRYGVHRRHIQKIISGAKWPRGQALAEFVLLLPVLLAICLGFGEAGFLIADKAAQDRATAVVADWVADHPGDDWTAVADDQLSGCDVEDVTDPGDPPDLVTIASTCTFSPRITFGLWDGLPISSEESASSEPTP